MDTEKFEPSDQTPNYAGPVRLITAGNLSWVKGQEFLLGALGLLRASEVDFRLRIIGDGPERQRLLYTIRDLGLGDAVVLLGQLDETQVRDELRQADIFVLSSLSEGISNAALEAMSCGLPVVSTDVGGMAEAIRDGVEGRLVPPRDQEAMAEALAQLGGNRQLRLQMGAAARDRVVSQFSLERHITAWRELLDTVMQRHRVGAMP
jgi:glycosyltransferase involved in cell wall biosynthesis